MAGKQSKEAKKAEREKWEKDMRAEADRRGVPAWRPLGTKASWWKKGK